MTSLDQKYKKIIFEGQETMYIFVKYWAVENNVTNNSNMKVKLLQGPWIHSFYLVNTSLMLS